MFLEHSGNVCRASLGIAESRRIARGGIGQKQQQRRKHGRERECFQRTQPWHTAVNHHWRGVYEHSAFGSLGELDVELPSPRNSSSAFFMALVHTFAVR